MFAALMGLDMMGFSVMAYYYKYVDSESDSKPKKNGKENHAYDEETDFNKWRNNALCFYEWKAKPSMLEGVMAGWTIVVNTK